MSDEKPMGQVIQIDEARIRGHLGEMVHGTVEETLNAMLDAEADQLCGAGRYERSQITARYTRWNVKVKEAALATGYGRQVLQATDRSDRRFRPNRLGA
jgi:hypothetical protein